MNSRRLMTLKVVVPPPQRVGAVPLGTRTIAPIASGDFEGPRLRGKVRPGGGDWTLLRSDGVLELDLRITLETDDGALIYLTSFGLRHGPPEVIAALGRGEAVDPRRDAGGVRARGPLRRPHPGDRRRRDPRGRPGARHRRDRLTARIKRSRPTGGASSCR